MQPLEFRLNMELAQKTQEQAKDIIGPLLIRDATFQEDVKEATDLVVDISGPKRLAIRVRRPGYWERYGHHITIREWNASPIAEQQKIMAGWGDWMFYGHLGDFGGIAEYVMVDLDVYRDLFARDMLTTGTRANMDGRTGLRWVDVRSFTEPGILSYSPGYAKWLDPIVKQMELAI